MKRFFSSFLLVVVLFTTLLSPIETYAASSNQLESYENAAMSALYDVIKDSGYNIYVPGTYTHDNDFTDVMLPLINRVEELGFTIEDAFYFMGDKMYYAYDIVKNWLTSIFGDNGEQSYDLNSGSESSAPSLTNYIVNYDKAIKLFLNSDGTYWNENYGATYNYPVFATRYYSDDMSQSTLPNYYIFPIIKNSDGLYHSYNTIHAKLGVYTSGNGVYHLSFNEFDGSAYKLYDTITHDEVLFKPTRDYRYYFLLRSSWATSSLDNGPYANWWTPVFNYSSQSYSSVTDAISEYLNYLNTYCFFNTYYYLYYGDQVFTNYVEPQSYMLGPSGHSNSTHQSYEPVHWEYVTNNWGSADTIYQTINNNTEYDSHDKYYDFDLDFDIDVEKSVNDLGNLPGTFETLSDGAINYVGGGGFSGQVSNIVNGLPSDLVWAVTVASIILLVTGLINRLLR